MTTTSETIEVTSSEILHRIYMLRAEVWQHEGAPPESFPNGQWTDELDQKATHWAVIREDTILAAARLSIHHTPTDLPDAHLFDLSGFTPPVAFFNRLVVHPTCRGLGFASRLDEVRLDRARSLHCSTVFLATAAEARIAALSRRGFVQTCSCIHPFALSDTAVAMRLIL